MRELTLIQIESVNGGEFNLSNCWDEAVGYGAATWVLGAALFTGPIGWGAVAAATLWGVSAYSIDTCGS